jgi:hypothetical protein
MAELGIKVNQTKTQPKASGLLDFAADKLKDFSDSKDVALVKHENPVNDATTYALNVGNKFSVSHTRKR